MASSRSEKWINHFIRMAEQRKSKTMGDVSMPKIGCGKQVTPQQQTYEQAVSNLKEQASLEKRQTQNVAVKSRAGTKQYGKQPIRRVKQIKDKKSSKQTKKTISNKKKLESIIQKTVFAPKK